eukprot:TRINITY_DN61910_c0_g1_i1.p1 TRINITY_DN61910_c0_g1~~TRINITY_DN61910_c0_g1_i1.p1  ORF type:complete len:112 (-),score=17.09 TRINITY_DN61910_c0_g1_i1:49-384(-)
MRAFSPGLLSDTGVSHPGRATAVSGQQVSGLARLEDASELSTVVALLQGENVLPRSEAKGKSQPAQPRVPTTRAQRYSRWEQRALWDTFLMWKSVYLYALSMSALKAIHDT